MKFINDTNPKKVRIVAENAAEEAWMSTLKESSKRTNRGGERFVRAACADWIRANGGAAAVAEKAEKAANAAVADLAAAWGAATNASPTPQWRQGEHVAAAKADAAALRAKNNSARAHAEFQEVLRMAEELEFDADYREGLAGKAESGALVSLLNTACQRSGVKPPCLAGVPWFGRAREILAWLGE